MYTVIVVDDEEDLRRGLIRKIEWEEIGFQVIGEAENGFEALDLVEKLEPDLLLSDIKMPFMSGIELARQVREIRPTIQIAFLSGYDDFAYAQQAIQYNIVSYMLKPISAKEITVELKKIKKIIDDKFEEFSGVARIQEKANIKDFVMSLILDAYQSEESQERDVMLVKRARECGLLNETKNNPHFTVIATSFYKKNGKNCTTEDNIHAIDMIVKKYMNHASFYVGNRIISLMIGTEREHEKYLHILVEDIVQSAKRIMGVNATMGISREVATLLHCHNAYLEAMSALAECNCEEGQVCYITDIKRTKNNSDICSRALELIELNYKNPDISLVSISTDISVTPNYLSALIKKSTGKTFIELLTTKRMEVAKKLLRNSELKIKDITEQCGYNDQHYFSYCFKKDVGVSPNVFRRQHEE